MRQTLLTLIAVLAGMACVAAQPQPPASDTALEVARRLTLGLVGMEHQQTPGHHQMMANEALREQVSPDEERLRAMGPAARRELEKVMEERPNHVDTVSAALGLFLVDRSQAAKATEALVDEMQATGFVNLMLADKAIATIGADAVPTLTRHLEDQMVVDLLGAMGPSADAAVPELKKHLGTDNVAIAVTLVRIGTAHAVSAAKPVLVRALEDPNSPYAKEAVIALGELGEHAKDAAPVLRKALAAVNPDTRVRAAVALAQIGDTEAAVSALGQLIADEELHERYVALRQLAALGPQAKGAVEPLLRIAEGEGEQRFGDRALAVIALARIDPSNPRIAAALQRASQVPEIRSEMEREGIEPP